MITFSVNQTTDIFFQEKIREAVAYSREKGKSDPARVIDLRITSAGLLPTAVEHKQIFSKTRNRAYTHREIPLSCYLPPYADPEDRDIEYGFLDYQHRRFRTDEPSSVDANLVVEDIFSRFTVDELEGLVAVHHGYSLTGIVVTIATGRSVHHPDLPNPRDLLFDSLEEVYPGIQELQDDTSLVQGVFAKILDYLRTKRWELRDV